MEDTKSVTVTLGELQDRVEARVRSGAYDSVSDVVRAGLRALDREEAMHEEAMHQEEARLQEGARLDEALRRKVREALDDRRPGIPADEVFAALRGHHADRVKAAARDA